MFRGKFVQNLVFFRRASRKHDQFVLFCSKNVENKIRFEMNVTTITGLKNP